MDTFSLFNQLSVIFFYFSCSNGAVSETTKATLMQGKDKRLSAYGDDAIFSGNSTSFSFTSYLEFSNNTVISHILPKLSTSLETAISSYTTQSVLDGNNNESGRLGNKINQAKINFTELSQHITKITAEEMLSTPSYMEQLQRKGISTDNGIVQRLTQTQYPQMTLSSSADKQVDTTDKIVPNSYFLTKKKFSASPSKHVTSSTTTFPKKVNKTIPKNLVMNTTYSYTPLNLTTIAITRATTSTTTDKHIYVRGHRIYKSKHRKSKSNIKTVSGYPLHHNQQYTPKPGRQKRKHRDGSKKESEEVFPSSYQNHGHQRSIAQTYAWLIGAAMLVIGSLLILLGGILLCYCGEKWSKHREDRRRREKYGDYERVESVSSLVSSQGPNHDCFDDNLETVSMI